MRILYRTLLQGRRSDIRAGLRIRVLLAWACCAWLTQTMGLSASQQIPVIDTATVEVGWENVCKVGMWAEVRVWVDETLVTTSDDSFTLTLSALDPQGHQANFRQKSSVTRADGKLRVSGLVKLGSLESPLLVRLETPHVIVQKRLRAGVDFEVLRQDTPLLLTYGSPSGFDFSSETVSDRLIDEPRVIDLPSADAFSLNPIHYEMVHALVCADRYDVPENVSVAWREWVSRGGHLLIAAGTQVEAFKSSALATWVPVEVGEVLRLRELTGFEAYVGRTVPIRVFDPVASPKLDVEQGIVLVRELDGPLAVRGLYGFGRVTVLGVSLNEDPVASWEPLPLAMIKLTDLATSNSATGIESGTAPVGRLGQSGISDLKTQLQMSAQTGLQPLEMSVWTIILLGFVMALVVGPLDYVLCRYVLKSPSLTWLTLPLWVIAGGLVIAQWNQARSMEEMSVGKTNLVDLNLTAGLVRERSWVSWISPVTKRYDLGVVPAVQTLAWSGEPENAFGGMYRARTVQLNRAEYDVELGESRAEGIPALTGTVNTWESQSQSDLEELAWVTPGKSLVEAELSASALGQLSGVLTHHLPKDLTDWILIYGPRVYFPRSDAGNTLVSGQTITLDNTLMTQSEISAFLRRQSSQKVKITGRIGEDIITKEESYDPLSTDLARIVRVISTYANFRGREYTRMSNAELSGEDLSSLIELDQAILIAEAPGLSTGQVSLDEKEVKANERTFLRVILPVVRSERGLRQLPLRLGDQPIAIEPERPFTGED